MAENEWSSTYGNAKVVYTMPREIRERKNRTRCELKVEVLWRSIGVLRNFELDSLVGSAKRSRLPSDVSPRCYVWSRSAGAIRVCVAGERDGHTS